MSDSFRAKNGRTTRLKHLPTLTAQHAGETIFPLSGAPAEIDVLSQALGGTSTVGEEGAPFGVKD